MKIFVKEAREKLGWSQRELADKAQISKSEVGCIETGGCDPTIGTMCRIANSMGIPVADLFSCENNNEYDKKG